MPLSDTIRRVLLTFVYCWDLLQHYFPPAFYMKIPNCVETQKELYNGHSDPHHVDSTINVWLDWRHLKKIFFCHGKISS